MRGELVDRILSFLTLAAVVGAVFWLNDRARERAQQFLTQVVSESSDLLTRGAFNTIRQIDDHLTGRGDTLWPFFFLTGLVLVWCLLRLEHRR
jgi:hypothetical protein